MAGYRINRQKPGTRISWWPDPRGPGHGEHQWGTIVDHMGDTVTVIWDDDDEFYEIWTATDIRYRIDRGQMRLKPPPKERRMRLPPSELRCKTCDTPRSVGCGCPRPGAVKPEHWGTKDSSRPLTKVDGKDRMTPSSNERSDDAHSEKGATLMATATGGKLSAKEAALELGTDARTLRKFLRKKNGLVGQGQRWEVDRKELKALKKDFDDWAGGKKEKKAPLPADDDLYDDPEEMEELDLDLELEELDGPDDDELEELELDDDDD